MSKTDSEIEDLSTDSVLSTIAYLNYKVLPNDGEEQGGILGYDRVAPTDRFNTEDFISRPYFSEKCDIEENILEFDFSFGYDCKKPYNLVRVDEHTLIFASGNLIHFFNVETKEVWFRRSAFGGGIGHIAKNHHADFPHIAVGENGINPPIIIYEWPSLEIMCILKYGTTRRYSHLNYSPDGKLLVSQGGDPDYLITVWNWPKSIILLRTKSYVNDVLRVMFSPEVPGHITSCGIAHIKFWKMVNTFTGLKLQGDIGRFGKTEYSDIIGIYPMADEKVISGCYWGNILVWDEGLIKLEVTRKGRKRCHDDAVVQIDYKNGELWTVGMDGRVRIWYYDTIDQADPPDDDRVVEMEPTYDFYTPGAEFMCILKQHDDPENSFYFAQDRRGGIWKIDLSMDSENVTPSERLLKCHAGVAESLSVCPWGPYFTTLGNGGRLHLYDYQERKLLLVHMFPAKGCVVIWVTLDMDPSGEVLILALADGAVRVVVLKVVKEVNQSKIHTIQLTKPHIGRITQMKFSRSGMIFLTAGEDKTVFLFQVSRGNGFKYLHFVPIGYINTPDVITCLTWHKNLDHTCIMGGRHGHIITVDFPILQQDYTTITYVLDIKQTVQRFTTVKSQILREIKVKEIERKRLAKRALKKEELDKFRKDNPGLDVDEEIFLADSESEEKLEALYIPEIPNGIKWIQHTEDDTLWLSMGGYDAGYIYEYTLGLNQDMPVQCTPVYNAENTVIYNFVYSKSKEFLIFGMEDGAVRVNRINQQNWRDLSNYWQLNMHDNFNGYIAGMQFSYDNSYFITCGHDGNIFTFRFYPDNDDTEVDLIPDIRRIIPSADALREIEDVSCEELLSLEQTIVKAEVDRINQVANDNKEIYLEKLRELRRQYESILAVNASLPKSQRIPLDELEIDPRVTENLNEKLALDQELVQRKLAFDVEKSALRMTKMRRHFLDSLDMFPILVTAVRNPNKVQCLPIRAMADDYDEKLELIDLKIAEDELKGRPPDRPPVTIQAPQAAPDDSDKLEYFLMGLSPSTIQNKLGGKINQLLDKYRQRKQRREKRLREWEAYNALKPSNVSSDLEDAAILKEATANIGEYKLKSSPDYKVPRHLRQTTFKKYKEILLVRARHYNLSHDFNVKVYQLRDKKKSLLEFLVEKTKALEQIHEEIDPEDHAFGPELFAMSDEVDFPDKGFEIHVEMPGEEGGRDDGKRAAHQLVDELTVREILHTIDNMEEEEQEVQSQWEYSLRKDRYRRMLFEQAETIRYMEMAIVNFNLAVRTMRLKRSPKGAASNLLNLHLMTLHQEFMILKDCESKEDLLSGNVHTKMIELMDIQDRTVEVTSQIDMYKKKIVKLEDKEKEIQRSFLNSASENKFFDFLRRIFKKKYKVPRVRTDSDSDSDSSSSSSSESEDVDAGSIDSKDFGIIRLDESVCPKGCDPNIYDLTFELRSQRHAVEHETIDINRAIEQLRKDYEGLQKRARVIENSLKTSQDELDEFQREKQYRLNQILCTVILRLDQFQNMDMEEGKMKDVGDSLIFSQNVFSNLYKRVGQLQVETQQQNEKRRLSVTHLNKMKTDFRQMTYTKKMVMAEVDELMRIQFGSRVNLDELQEYLLKTLIFEYKITAADIKSMFTNEINLWYNIHRDRQKEARRMLRMNTNKYDVLTLVTKERIELAKLSAHQDDLVANSSRVDSTTAELQAEIKKLKVVIKKQEEDMAVLRKEIKLYKTKGYALKPEHPPFPEPSVQEEEEVETPIPGWEYLDDYKFTEEYAIEYWKNQEQKAALKYRHECIMAVMDELFENIRVQLTHNQMGRLLSAVISDVMDKCDIEQILSDLLSAIPPPYDDDQQSLLELTAEKLYSVEENLIDEEIRCHSMEILQAILEDIMENPDQVTSVKFDHLLSVLTENLPLDMIFDRVNFDVIMHKLKKSRVDLHIVQQKLEEEDSKEVQALASQILHEMSKRKQAAEDSKNIV